MKKVKLAIVDDHVLFRKGMIALLHEFDTMSVEFDAGNGQELLDKLKDQPVDVVLLDLDMPVLNGFDTVRIMKKEHPSVKIVIISMHNDESVIEALLQSGAHGFLIKNQDIEIVIDCVESIVETGFYFNPEISEKQRHKLISIDQILAKFKSVDLTDNEIEVIIQICKLNTNKQIAKNLKLSVRTIDGYIERILRKTSVKNRTGIVMYAMEHNLVKKI